MLGITDHHRVTVSVHFVGRSEAAELLVVSLNDREVSQPLKGFPNVAAPHAGGHTREVFRAPARAV